MQPTDPSHDLFFARQPLDALFAPRVVAVVGATETAGAVGRTLLWNLLASPFGGTVYPVNPHRRSVLGVRAYPTLRDVPDAVDLAVIATPADSVPQVVRECVGARVQAAVVISAGFREVGERGAALEAEVLKEAQKGSLRLLGPNSLGLMRPHRGLNATFAQAHPRPGSVALLSQSGALVTAVLDWGARENVGFSAVVSLGSMLDVGWGEAIDFLGNDPHTESILLYMETLGDARRLLSAAREVALQKPILVLKAGRDTRMTDAVASHTGAMVGTDAAVEAALRRVGVLRVDTIAELFYTAETLAKQPRPAGPRLTILSNAGGPALLAADALLDGGGELAPLTETSTATLEELLPPEGSAANPVDLLHDAGPDRFEQALKTADADPHSDGTLVVFSPQAGVDPAAVAERLRPHA
ncbi:MAG: CoA-binding protein, partial [Rhodothermales bacterium]|nr:CoA-binding protein [Rhodothermales bacterium]